MPKKKYIVSLTDAQRQDLEQFVMTGVAAAYAINHARILLKASTNQAGGSWLDEEISSAIDVSVATVERIRKQFVTEGLEPCLKQRRRQRTRSRRLDGEQEAHLIAIACSAAPAGQARWTLRLLADRMVELGQVESLCYETVRRTLKKTSLSLGSTSLG